MVYHKIVPNDLKRQFELYQSEYEQKALEVLRSGWYILGKELELFEREWADYIGVKHCVGLASGLDSLWIGMRLLGINKGDEVIVASNAYIACVMAITMNGAIPVFVEPDEYYGIDSTRIEAAITSRTKAILSVHLYGQVCDMDAIRSIADRHGLLIIEDCAQSHGSRWHDSMAGSLGDIGCFSFYPSKGCGAFGDGGCITTNDEALANKIRVFRNYGSNKRYYNEMIGANSRLDELQAGLLRVKLSHIDELNSERDRLTNRYLHEIDNEFVKLPRVRAYAESTWHQFVVRCSHRDELKSYLEMHGVGSLIHYPIPPHLSEAYAYLGYQEGSFPIAERIATEVLSLPIYNGMTSSEQDYVIKVVNEFRPTEELV